MKESTKSSIALLGLIAAYISIVGYAIYFQRHKPKPVMISTPPITVRSIEDLVFNSSETVVYLPAPQDPPPSVVKVGPYHWTLTYAKLEPGTFGEDWPMLLEIRLNPKLPPDQLKETLLHELFHASIFIGSGGVMPGSLEAMDPKIDDVFIEQTAPTLLQVLRDNPELVKWLQKEKHEERIHTTTSLVLVPAITGSGTETSSPTFVCDASNCHQRSASRPGRVQE